MENLVELGLVNAADLPVGGKSGGIEKEILQDERKFSAHERIHYAHNQTHVLMERRLDREIGGDVQYAALLGCSSESPDRLLIFSGRVNRSKARQLSYSDWRRVWVEINFNCMTTQDYIYRKEWRRFLCSILDAKSVIINKMIRDEIMVVH